MSTQSPPEFPLAWAEAWGEDQYGLWMELKVKEASQIFRWIEPGTFLMGSPENEPQRNDDEVLHKVTHSEGFWLADTAVTQALWEVIMGDNPSHFKGAQLPIEEVSWDDSQQFIEKLNEKFDMEFSLPWEAQWEYACRAGTQTPYSFGENITTDMVNYDGDFPYHNGEKGEDRRKTVAVKSLPCNEWGLYEMHGNVWEWCQDKWQGEHPAEPVIDPRGTEGENSYVLRGGSWFDGGGGVRSAIRVHVSPDGRDDDAGFRLSLGL